MEDVRWKMEDGRWKMSDGRWREEGGEVSIILKKKSSRMVLRGLFFAISAKGAKLSGKTSVSCCTPATT
jgi:hypothetical protein